MKPVEVHTDELENGDIEHYVIIDNQKVPILKVTTAYKKQTQ